jgi:hypothetical protein
VGNVFYSEQGAQFGEAEEAGVTRSTATRKFIDFLRNFRGDPAPGRPDGETLYRDRLVVDPPPNSITVSLDDLIAHDADLAAALRKNPAEYVPLVRAAPGRAARRAPRAAEAHAPCLPGARVFGALRAPAPR